MKKPGFAYVAAALTASLVLAFGMRAGARSEPTLRDAAARSAQETSPPVNWRKTSAYVGSDACQRCHESAYDQWKRAIHLQMIKPIAEARVLGDFTPGTRFEAHGRAYRVEQKDGRYFISISHGGRPAESFEVNYTLGVNRFQGYLSKLPDGRIYVLPAFWSRESQRWLDWKETTPVPDTDKDLRQIWNVTCFNCHATNLSKNFDVKTKTYDTRWQELGIGCEACHGPGEAHIALMTEWEANPGLAATEATLPKAGRSDRIRIFDPRSATRREVFDTCSYCHGNKDNAFVGFVPGERYDDYAVPFLVSQEIPEDDPQGDFWPDGRPSRFNRPQALMMTGCFEKSEIVCTSCHVAHGSRNAHSLKLPIERSNLLCTQCHKSRPAPAGAAAEARPPTFEGAGLEQHTHHPAASLGSRCINCHMSSVNWRLLMRRRDHTFQAPVPELTAKYGIPNACTECHDDKPPEWASARIDDWYGPGDRQRRQRAVELADAMYTAGSGDAGAIPALARIAVDRSRPAPIRASAAQFIGRLVSNPRQGGSSSSSQTSFEGGASHARPAQARPAAPVIDGAIVNAMIGAAVDPEPMVRATAVHTLGLFGERRVLPALTARLVDSSRVVRTTAAAALLALGVTRLDGAVGAVLSRAQDEYAARLRTFPEHAGDTVTLGWLEAERGREAEAKTALDNALLLDPDNLQARVFLGVVAARQGRFDDALQQWRQVRRRDPSFPNIDRLIAEAEARKAGTKPGSRPGG